MKKPLKIFLGVLGAVALIGICFGCLAIYAKKEINKPKFEMPDPIEITAKSPLPKTKDEAFDYVAGLFEGCLSSDNTELSEHTYINLTNGEIKTSLSDEDSSVLSRALEQAQDKLTGLFKPTENVLVNKLEKAPALGFTKSDVEDFTAEKGVTNENGETNDDGFYYLTFTVKPEAIDKAALLDGEIKKTVLEELEPMLSVSSLEVVPEGFTARFKIGYADDSLVWVEIKQNVRVKAKVDFTADYKALSDKTAEFEIPLEKTVSIDLFSYGLDFTERQIALQVGDSSALPLDVRVNSETTKGEYKLSFTVSDDKALTIDADGVAEAIGPSKEPLTVTATLEYEGHTYSDKLTVYTTELEVKTDEP
ncbi:MAG: hypothetical protein E7515_02620 [Ruminococcaceae bacterium]|nr:hypothetical protein [Oscillospiraceae bacterium]